jgi:hypothetical protein
MSNGEPTFCALRLILWGRLYQPRMLSGFTEWSRADVSDMDGQVDRSSERERTSQTPYSTSDSLGFSRLAGLDKHL